MHCGHGQNASVQRPEKSTQSWAISKVRCRRLVKRFLSFGSQRLPVLKRLQSQPPCYGVGRPLNPQQGWPARKGNRCNRNPTNQLTTRPAPA